MPRVLHVSDLTRYQQPFPAEFKSLYHSVEIKLWCRFQLCLNKSKNRMHSEHVLWIGNVSIQYWKNGNFAFNILDQVSQSITRNLRAHILANSARTMLPVEFDQVTLPLNFDVGSIKDVGFDESTKIVPCAIFFFKSWFWVGSKTKGLIKNEIHLLDFV